MAIDHPGFFKPSGPFTLAEVAASLDVELDPQSDVDPAREIAGVAPIDEASPTDLTFLDNPKYKDRLASTRAAACLAKPGLKDAVPSGVGLLATADPYRGFARALTMFYPDAAQSPVLRSDAGGLVDPTARIEEGAVIEPGAMIGAEAEIGRGTRICGGAVVGYRCTVGRDCYIGPNATVVCGLVGDRVILHAGSRIGTDGFGFAMGPTGHFKVPQIGRVIIQDDVEVGANTTIDRGALKDTVIGEGTKIDNLVQIGHNVIIGRHCVIVAHVGISGSTKLGDFVVMGGQSGTVGHVDIGSGTMVAGASHVKDSLGPGLRVGGTPAKPLREWARELAAIKRLGRSGKTKD